MATGINENIEVLGRVLHIQTEIVQQDGPVIRTTVYDGGRIVATREAAVEASRQSDSEMLEQLRAHHAMIIGNLLTRSDELGARKRAPRSAASSATPSAVSPGRPAARSDHPIPAGTDPALRRALRSRRLVGPFSQRYSHAAPAVVDRELDLDAAARMIRHIMESPAFLGLRVDEQVRFFDLRERLGQWRETGLSDRDHDELVEDIADFARHLEAVNHRKELMNFDHRLLLWAIESVGENGVTDHLIDQLEPLRGRDVHLDGVLDDPDTISGHQLLELLMALLDRTLTGR